MSNELPVTEQENPRSQRIDTLSIAETVALINDEDRGVAAAVRLELPRVTLAVEGIVERLKRGGRLIYVGTGTSGLRNVVPGSKTTRACGNCAWMPASAVVDRDGQPL